MHRYASKLNYKTLDFVKKLLPDCRKFNYKTFQSFVISIIKHLNIWKTQ